MKITKKNIQKLTDGDIGTIIEKRHGMTNLLSHVKKTENIISVEAREDQGATVFSIDSFCEAYKGKNLIWI